MLQVLFGIALNGQFQCVPTRYVLLQKYGHSLPSADFKKDSYHLLVNRLED